MIHALTLVQADAGVIGGDQQAGAILGIKLDACDLSTLGLLASTVLDVCIQYNLRPSASCDPFIQTDHCKLAPAACV